MSDCKENNKLEKILYIAEIFPFPYTTGGKLRTANILIQLSKKYEIDFISYSTDPVNSNQINQASRYCNSVSCYAEGIPSKLSRGLNFVRLKSNKAFIVYSKNMQRKIDELLKINNYTFIVLERLYSYPYIEKYFCKKDFNIPVLLNMHDVENDTIRYFRKMSHSIIKKAYYSVEYRNIVHLEKKAISTVTLMIAVSERDMKCYQEKYPLGKNKWIYINNGVDIGIAQNEPIVKRDKTSVLFLGSMRHPPNMEGIKWFINEIWDKVLLQDQNAELLIVGSGEMLQADKTALSIRKGVKVLGFIENIYPVLRKCTCMVVPLLSGSGTRLKILEAFSFRTPVVSTTIGAEGLGVEDGKQLLLADDEKNMADKVLKLFHSENLCHELSECAFDLVRDSYDWNNIGDKLIYEIDKLKR